MMEIIGSIVLVLLFLIGGLGILLALAGMNGR